MASTERGRSGEETLASSSVVVAAVTDNPLVAADLLERLGTREDGAAVVFEGRVRARSSGRVVVRLHYEAYREMADEVLREIAREALALQPVTQVAVEHRVGTLEAGEVSLVVAAASPHRDPAMAAVRYVIEQLKTRLPVWKKEEYEDGSATWLDGHPVERA
jgi:molybdopterin synthase catalytic subunit